VIVHDKAGNSIELSSAGVVINSGAVKIGSEGAAQSLVLGDALMHCSTPHAPTASVRRTAVQPCGRQHVSTSTDE